LAAQQEAKMDRILIANVKITNEGLGARGGANERGTLKMQFFMALQKPALIKEMQVIRLQLVIQSQSPTPGRAVHVLRSNFSRRILPW
jgi:hypothetical protein